MIRYITLLTVTLLLTVSCSSGSDADTGQVAPPTLKVTVTPFTPTPTQVPSTPTPTQVPSTPTPTQVPPTSTPTSTPTQLPAIVGTVRFQVDVQQVTSASQLGQASIVGPSLIHLKDGRTRLYLQARADRRDKNSGGVNIISLISTSGTQWDVEPGIRISHGSESDVDTEAGEPGVYLGLDDKYHMAYTGRYMGIDRKGESRLMHRVVFAVSDDGLAWNKLNRHYADPQNINDFASSADVAIVNGEYVIYYTGQRNIIRATYDGLTWVRQEIAFSVGHDSTMIKFDGVYYMFLMIPKALEYGRNPDTQMDLLFMAVSSDGVNWPNNYYQVIVVNTDGSEVDANNIQDPGAIILSDGSLRIFLNDFGGKNIFSIKPIEKLPKP